MPRHTLLLSLLPLLLSPTPLLAQSAPPPVALRCLQEAYPTHICGLRPDALVWCDGEVMPYGAATPGDLNTRLAAASLHDQMSMPYAPGAPPGPPGPDQDPGRLRHEPFFRKMYGHSAREVAATLAPITWLPGHSGATLKVTTVNEVHRKLEAVSNDLLKLPPEILRKVTKPSGTFHWRTIKGSSQRSMHSFAIAIDVGVEHSDYWRWSKPDPQGHYPYRNRIPLEVVQIFEAHGFIWGGKWHHFDTMHFEYRPELLHPLCRAPLPPARPKPHPDQP